MGIFATPQDEIVSILDEIELLCEFCKGRARFLRHSSINLSLKTFEEYRDDFQVVLLDLCGMIETHQNSISTEKKKSWSLSKKLPKNNSAFSRIIFTF